MNIRAYKFLEGILLRTPAYSHQSFELGVSALQARLDDPFFLSALLITSDSLYSAVLNAGFSYAQMTQRLQTALQRYHNRMTYRCTPFGLFAGNGFIRWGSKDNIVIAGGYPQFLYSYEQITATVDKYLFAVPDSQKLHRLNESLYKVNGCYRLIFSDKQKNTFHFCLQEIEQSALLERIVEFYAKEQSDRELALFLSKSGVSAPAEIIALLKDQQIIVPVTTPLAMDMKYLDDITVDLQSGDIRSVTTFDNLSGIPEFYKSLASQNVSDNFDNHGHPKYYVNFHHVYNGSEIQVKYQEQISDGLYCLDKLIATSRPESLSTFIDQFKLKFDRRTIPLLKAIDPEVGVGYGDLATLAVHSCLMPEDGIVTETRHEDLSWTATHGLLLKKWGRSVATKNIHTLILNEDEITSLPDTTERYPNSIPVLFQISDDHLYIESAGGATATALQARFTLFDQDVFQQCREIVHLTETANPDVIFAAVRHQDDVHTANIERSKLLWNYEIPILTASAVPQDRQIGLGDLYIKVQNNQLILISGKHHKRVIPVLNSAYNYTRSELAVFRLLCDLQHQGMKNNLHFDLKSWFPGLDHYPRVLYKKTILSLEQWKISKSEVNKVLAEQSADDRLAALKILIKERCLPMYVTINEHDNHIVINTSDILSLSIMMSFFKKDGTIDLSEFPFAAGRPLVSNAAGAPFTHQMIASLWHNEKIYEAADIRPAIGASKRKFLPGSSWLYCKLYCHPSRANELLTENVRSLVSRLEKQEALNKWFFIRYSDPEYHIRLRLNIRVSDFPLATELLKKSFEKLLHAGILSDYSFETYERELERYGAHTISDIETLFYIDSRDLLQTLHMVNRIQDGESYLLSFSNCLIDKMCDVFRYPISERIIFFKELFEALSAEKDMKLSAGWLKDRFRLLRNKGIFEPPDLPVQKIFNRREHILNKLYSGTQRSNGMSRKQLLADLIHMHCNRMITAHHRKQEMVLYYCLWRHYESLNARLLVMSAGS